MTKTPELRRLIVSILNTTQGGTYYKTAPDKAAFPYKVFNLDSVNLGDLERDDIILTIDIWDLAADPKAVEEIADILEDKLNAANLPQDGILPTFYRSARRNIEEADKDLQRIQLEILIQNYKRR